MNNLKPFWEYISENAKIETKYLNSDKYLYHATNIKNKNDIERYGLIPHFGNTIKTTSTWDFYVNGDGHQDDEDFESMYSKNGLDGILFFSETPMLGYSNFSEKYNQDEAVLCIIEKSETTYLKKRFDILNHVGNRVEAVRYQRYNYINVDNLPPFIEDGDWFSLDEQEPIAILHGDSLEEFMNKKFPKL
jgi:hypothetical protein